MARLTETEKQQLLDATRRKGPSAPRKLLSMPEYLRFLRAGARCFPPRRQPWREGNQWKL